MESDGEISVHLLSPCGARANYKAEWLLPGSKKRHSRSLNTTDPETAQKRRQALEYELNHGLYKPPTRTTWPEFRKCYELEKVSGLKLNSRKCSQRALDRFEREMKPRTLTLITERTLSEYVGILRRAGLKASSIQTYLCYLKAALFWAWRQKFIPEVPHIEGIKLPKKRKMRTLDLQGLKVLLDSFTSREAPQWRLLTQMGWYTGLRCEELFMLRWDEQGEESPWLDLKVARLWIPAAACKADEDSWVPIHPALLAILKPIAQHTGRVFCLAGSPGGMSRQFGKRASRAGYKITLHDLRRSFGSRYARAVPAQVLQRLMRHSDIRTTLKYYVDLDHGLDEAITKA